MKIVSIFILFVLYSCSQSSGPTGPNSINYFFDCTVDGKHINVSYTYPATPPIGVLLNSGVTTEISTLASSQTCNTSGSYCFQKVMYIRAQTTGTYTPERVVITTTEGADSYTYIQNSDIIPRGNITAYITDIQRGNPGILKGNFSGTMMRFKNYETNGTSVSVNCTFVLPLL